MHRTHEPGALAGRDTQYVDLDSRVVRWIAQAAVNVELFTIPLYMTSLYSISGKHPITGKGNDFYKGRVWPGAKPSVKNDANPDDTPDWGNQRAFNIVFSVFIQEMLHLQLASNIATAVGAKPSYTSTALQSADHGWTCYGPDKTAIPNIVDLTDTSTYDHVKVNVGPLDANSIDLFLAIEQSEEAAQADIVRNVDKYFPKIPFSDDPSYDPATANITFGTIGYMYQCYRDYLSITYTDGTRLWDHVFTADGQQNDLFNVQNSGHPMIEFPGFEATLPMGNKDAAFLKALDMMNAITDQGEGATLKSRPLSPNEQMLTAVENIYCPDRKALEADYPSFDDKGDPVPSVDAAARADNAPQDHFERFAEVKTLLDKNGVQTWDQAGKAGNWTEDDLKTPDYKPELCGDLPTPKQIADAMNALYADDSNFTLLSKAVVGAIKGITTVLDSYWNPETPGQPVGFPFPSMVGSGDRMSTAWAVFGKTPDLSVGIAEPDTSKLNHACQGLRPEVVDGKVGGNDCAQTPIFHTCRGSNACKGMGGCGFVQSTSGGGSCGGGGCGSLAATPGKVGDHGCSAIKVRTQGGVLCGGPTPPAEMYTTPSDNICGGYGGCAVPISACQVYPTSGEMEVWVLDTDSSKQRKLDPIAFHEGDRVEDIAYKAFKKVAEAKGVNAPDAPAPNALRLAFPPST